MTTMIWSLNWRIPSVGGAVAAATRTLLEGLSPNPQVRGIQQYGAGLDQEKGEEVGHQSATRHESVVPSDGHAVDPSAMAVGHLGHALAPAAIATMLTCLVDELWHARIRAVKHVIGNRWTVVADRPVPHTR
jgi:hypothetical protein